MCVTTFTIPVHVHGAYFVSFLLLTGGCYGAETSIILLLLGRAFAWYAFEKFWGGHSFIKILKKPKAIVQGFFFGVRKNVLRNVIHLKVNKK